jgi:3-deoxy-D-manno-octulosonic-acid transferase
LGELPGDASFLTVVVPRHPQRFDEVADLSDSRRSRRPLPAENERIHLGDSMGEMAFYYAACDVAVIGGSFEPLGGQNLIEALAAGAPVIVGPSMFNFTEATRLALEAGAALQVNDPQSAIREAAALLARPEKRLAMREAGKRLCQAHRGATARHLEVCERLIRPSRAP